MPKRARRGCKSVLLRYIGCMENHQAPLKHLSNDEDCVKEIETKKYISFLKEGNTLEKPTININVELNLEE
ncbi:hypothetical protein CWI39_2613p0010 [Hamiltosporidium magnivora]|uniref:Uncharacterized protein n=1 Tax=Hamiltosporidium magnivora TaxID=148818 RepID=A0A4Q9KTD7_9MICR|nr:hypothetical protein CWI39_2613p0010 [Hamiltosporidium magnivora]